MDVIWSEKLFKIRLDLKLFEVIVKMTEGKQSLAKKTEKKHHFIEYHGNA